VRVWVVDEFSPQLIVGVRFLQFALRFVEPPGSFGFLVRVVARVAAQRVLFPGARFAIVFVEIAQVVVLARAFRTVEGVGSVTLWHQELVWLVNRVNHLLDKTLARIIIVVVQDYNHFVRIRFRLLFKAKDFGDVYVRMCYFKAGLGLF